MRRAGRKSAGTLELARSLVTNRVPSRHP
jgi:hypothetical protein